jgi:hypothetical protein
MQDPLYVWNLAHNYCTYNTAIVDKNIIKIGHELTSG